MVMVTVAVSSCNVTKTHSKNEPSRVGSGSILWTREIMPVSSSMGIVGEENARLHRCQLHMGGTATHRRW